MTFRIAAMVLLAGTVIACAVDVARLGHGSDPQPSSMREISDPMVVELARCKALGPEVANDQACKSAWRKSRERFLAPGTPYQDRTIDLFPATPDPPAGNPPPKIYLDHAPSAPRPDVGGKPGGHSEGP
jgi:conjugative transfer region protein TrbK